MDVRVEHSHVGAVAYVTANGSDSGTLFPDQMSPHKRALSLGACALAAGLCAPEALQAVQKPRATPRPAAASPKAPTPIPTPLPPEREGRQHKGAAPDRRVARYGNPYVSFSKLTKVEEVDLDRDGAFEALVSGIGTFKGLPPDIPAVGFVSRTRLPFENPILAVFKKGKGND